MQEGATSSHDQSLYGTAWRQVFNDTVAREGADGPRFRGYDPKAPDYQALMTKIADKGPDILYVGATVENNPAKILLDMRSLMPVDQVIFMGADGLINQAFIDGAGDAANGAFITFAGFPPAELKGAGRRLREADHRDPRSFAGRLCYLRLRSRRRRHAGD